MNHKASIDFYQEGFKAFDPNIPKTVGDTAVIFYEIQGVFDDLDNRWPGGNNPHPDWVKFCHGYTDAATEYKIKENPLLTEFAKYCVSNSIDLQHRIRIGEASYDWGDFKDILKYLSRKNT
jgi:hypothetical protein